MKQRIGPWIDSFEITPSDTATWTDDNGNDIFGEAFIVGGAGDVVIETPSGRPITIPSAAITVGKEYFIAFRKVKSTGTTATSIFGCYSKKVANV